MTDDGAPAKFYPDYNRCVINMSMPAYEVASYFVHEMHHAKQFHEGKSPKAETDSDRKHWVDTMVTEECDGTYYGFLHKLALERRNLAPEDDRPPGMNFFRGAYRHGMKMAQEKGLEGVEAGDMARANAKKMVDLLIRPPQGTRHRLGVGAGGDMSYTDYYSREWEKARQKAGLPVTP